MRHFLRRTFAIPVSRSAILTAAGLFLVACSGAVESDEGTIASPLDSIDEATETGRTRPGRDESQPIYAYADAIRESIWVTTELDNDGDGQRDTVAVDLVRPREAAAKGIKVPVILEASPYYATLGRGNESETKKYDANGVISKMPLFYDNYFVPRGYAFVSVDLIGTNRSKGCMDVGGSAEILGTKAVIDWLNGRTTAARADGSPVVADWTNGKVGMIGKSWDGTIANGVAATGVEGLVTIVPIAAISSWYVYTRADGVLRGRDRFGYLSQFNARPAGVCDPVLAGLRRGEDDATGNYNDFFVERDYLPNVDRVRASVFVHHGLDDWNVTTPQFGAWWRALAARGVPRKIWLARGAHIDPFDNRRTEWVHTLHRWFDFWLQGRKNGIMREPMASIEQAPGQWSDERSWPADTHTASFRLGVGDGTTGTLAHRGESTRSDELEPDEASFRLRIASFTDDSKLGEARAVSDPNTRKDGRLVFLGRPLARDVRIAGRPSVTLRVRADKPQTGITARLVDYGRAPRLDDYRKDKGGLVQLTTKSCWGEATAADGSCYFDLTQDVKTTDFGVVTRGWLDAAHRFTLHRSVPLVPDHWTTLTVRLDTKDAIVSAGHVIGLVITATDPDLTRPPADKQGATLTLDPRGSHLSLPLVDRDEEDIAAEAPPSIVAPQPLEAAAESMADDWDPFASFH